MKPIGLGIIGAGRIGTLRARLAAKHAGVRFIAVSDSDPKNAARTAGLCGAALICARTSFSCCSYLPYRQTFQSNKRINRREAHV